MRGLTTQEAFRRFHEGNPAIYVLFKRFTFEVMGAGFARYSARTIVHRIRWHEVVEHEDTDFKINDHHSPYYARMFHEDHPEHGSFFELRQVTQDPRPIRVRRRPIFVQTPGPYEYSG